MRAEIIAAFTASVFINTAMFATLDKTVFRYEIPHDIRDQAERRALQKNQGRGTQFDFVEVPPVVSLRKPLQTNKIAAHDSAAQDQSKALDAPREAGPKIEQPGTADQLEQRRAENLSSKGTRASAPSSPTPPSPPAEERKEETAPKPESAPKNAQSPSAEAPDPSAMTLQAPSAPPKPPTAASPASNFRPAAQGSASSGRIDTPAVSRARSHGAQVYGMTSFDATGSGMGKYMKNLKERIWLAWFPYTSFHYPKDFRAADAVIQFQLDAEGQVRNVQIVKTEGSALFAAFCMEAVQRASPFGPLPAEVRDLTGKDELDVQFVFHFW